MSGTWPKSIRDPVHNLILFHDIPCDNLLLRLINAKEFQRLRRIKQLGFSELVFPGANHSRFAHSIGVLQTTRLILERLERLDVTLDAEARTDLLAASLLHDVGHGPFSHAFEKVTGDKHEGRTRSIILDPDTEVHRTLGAERAARISRFFDADPQEENAPQTSLPPFLVHVVSSQLDADRFDYLLRDSRAAGVDYGLFDRDWLISNLFVNAAKRRLYLGPKAHLAVEAYVSARYRMYRSVYFHKTTRAAEVMLKLVFRRLKELLAMAAGSAVVPDCPPALIRAFSSGRTPLVDYLSLDDHTVTEFLKAAERASDTLLRRLASDLLHRRLFKATDTTGVAQTAVVEFCVAARERLRSSGLDEEYSWISDDPADTPYKPYEPDDERPAIQIYIETAGGEQREISRESEVVAALRKPYSLTRYYYPPDVREDIDVLGKRFLKKGKP